jgi:amino acid permease
MSSEDSPRSSLKPISEEEKTLGIPSRSNSDEAGSNDGHRLKRDLKVRHISMIAMGGAVGKYE